MNFRMKCRNCGTSISMFQILVGREETIICEECGRKYRVYGFYPSIIFATVVFMFFPYSYIRGSSWSFEIVFLSAIFVYLLAYILFIRIE